MAQEVRTVSENSFEKVRKFSDLFDLINSKNLGKEYQDAYEEAVGMAKNFVDTKSKDTWDADKFESDIGSKYPEVSKDFVSALKLCIENYNPPVNLPSGPLWE